MEETEFTLNGKRYRLTRQQVQQALRDVEPDIIYDLAVWVNDIWYPAKQPFVKALGLTNRDVNSRTALMHLAKLGFLSHDSKTEGPRPANPAVVRAETASPETRRLALTMAVETARAGGAAEPDDVIAIADSYARWLSGA